MAGKAKAGRTGTGKHTRFSPEFKAKALARIRAGEPVARLSKELHVSEPSLYAWAGHVAKHTGQGRGKRAAPVRAAARTGKVAPAGPLARNLAALQAGARDDTLLLAVRTWLRDGWRWVREAEAAGEFKDRSTPDRGHLMLELALSEIERATRGR